MENFRRLIANSFRYFILDFVLPHELLLMHIGTHLSFFVAPALAMEAFRSNILIDFQQITREGTPIRYNVNLLLSGLFKVPKMEVGENRSWKKC